MVVKKPQASRRSIHQAVAPKLEGLGPVPPRQSAAQVRQGRWSLKCIEGVWKSRVHDVRGRSRLCSPIAICRKRALAFLHYSVTSRSAFFFESSLSSRPSAAKRSLSTPYPALHNLFSSLLIGAVFLPLLCFVIRGESVAAASSSRSRASELARVRTRLFVTLR